VYAHSGPTSVTDERNHGRVPRSGLALFLVSQPIDMTQASWKFRQPNAPMEISAGRIFETDRHALLPQATTFRTLVKWSLQLCRNFDSPDDFPNPVRRAAEVPPL
jgi:hypothetical protein